MDSDGFLTWNRYRSRIMRPSSRMRPFSVMKSLMGVSCIFFSTASDPSVPAALTAFR
ncbi:hypothetical protein D3C81_2309180 [compost metagenome]